MERESTKIKECLRAFPTLNESLSLKKFVIVTYDSKPIMELCRIPKGVIIKKMSSKELSGLLMSDRSIKRSVKTYSPGFILKTYMGGTSDIIHIYHLNAPKSFDKTYNLYSVLKNAELNIVEKFRSINNGESHIASEWIVEAGAVVNRYSFGNVDNCNEKSDIINKEFIKLFEGSQYNSYRFYFSKGIFKFCGKIINDFHINLAESMASCNMRSISALANNAVVENSIIIKHSKSNCQSLQLFKGLYDDASVGKFDSCVVVEQHAQKSNSIQKNNNILLSDQASVQSNPKLEIFADDVKCAHGSTTGEVDPSAIFYMRSRGLSKVQANNILLNAFVRDVLDEVKHEGVKEEVLENLNKQLSSFTE